MFFEYGAITELLRGLGDGLLGSDVAAFEFTHTQFRMQRSSFEFGLGVYFRAGMQPRSQLEA